MSGAGAFMESFSGSYQKEKDRQSDVARREEDRARDLEYRRNARADRTSDRTYRDEELAHRRDELAYRRDIHGATTGGGNHEPFRTSDPVNMSLKPHQRAMLNAIAGGESGGAYNVRYSPEGGVNFDLKAGHPRVFEPGPHGPSSAAGRYQHTWTTWKDTAGEDVPFTEENQDLYAWRLASDRYAKTTGRDLDADLMDGGLSDGIMDALSPTWASFKSKKNRGRWAATYQDSLDRYGAPPEEAPARQPRTIEDEAPEQGTGFVADVRNTLSKAPFSFGDLVDAGKQTATPFIPQQGGSLLRRAI